MFNTLTKYGVSIKQQLSMRSKKPCGVLWLFSVLWLVIPPVSAQSIVPPKLSDLTAADARQAFIAFINMTTAPGAEGSSLKVDLPGRQTDIWRSSLGFSSDFSLRNSIYDGYWGLALAGGGLSDTIQFLDDDGEPIVNEVNRNIIALSGSLGLSFPINQYLKVRPFASLVLSQSTSEAKVLRSLGSDDVGPDALILKESSAEAVSGVAALDVLYSKWYRQLNVDFLGRYTINYTDAFSIDNPVLDTWAWGQSLFFKGRVSGPTSWIFKDRKWRWNSYYSHTNYLDQNKTALGFRYLNEIGVGVDWDMHVKPLDWFGWRYIGIRAGYTFGDDVSGFNIGISAR